MADEVDADAGQGPANPAGPNDSSPKATPQATGTRPPSQQEGAPPAGYTMDRLFRSYHAILMNFLRQRLFNKFEAEDVAQEVYYRIARRPGLEQLAYPKAFLMQTARNLLIDMNRHRRKRQAAVQLDMEALASAEDISAGTPETNLQVEQMVNAVETLLSQLDARYQAVFWMHRIEGKTYRQISEELNIAQSTVEKRMRHTLEYLMSAMEMDHE